MACQQLESFPCRREGVGQVYWQDEDVVWTGCTPKCCMMSYPGVPLTEKYPSYFPWYLVVIVLVT